MASNQSALTNWAQYLAVRGVEGFLHCFDAEQNLHTAATIGSLFYRMSGRRRARAERNLALSFPEWSEARVQQVAEASMQHMFKLFMVDSVVMPRIVTRTTWPRHIRLGKLAVAIDQLLQDGPVILLTGHLGNWEVLGFALSVIGFPVTALARPIDNPLINDYLLGLREARGMRIITKFGATTVLPDLLRQGRHVGFIADQNAGQQGLFVPFFGRLASSYKSIGLLAMQFEVPIMAGCARRCGERLEFEIDANDIIRPDDWVDHPDPLFYITARYNRAMEQAIRVAPEQYLWLHRRWKSRPRHERRGQPVPPRLIARLETLPWMTQAELDRIVTLSNDAGHEEVR